MKLELCKKVCSECPFVEGALPGWLGSNTVEQILGARSFIVYPENIK